MKLRVFGAMLLSLLLYVDTASAKTELLVYTAVEPNYLNLYKKGFESAYPDISITWVRDSTGVITARLLAEKDAPKADAVFGLAASSLLLLQKEGLLLPYKPEGYDKLSPRLRDNAAEPVWVAMNAWTSGMAINKPEMEKLGLPHPKTWADLADPRYKGLIAMPDPASSGTGYMNLAAWIQVMGEEKGWAYADALMANVKLLSHSGSKPGTMAAQGEIAIGIGSPAFMKPLLKRRAPIDIVFMEDGLGWEAEATAIIKTTDKADAARKLMDWTCSEAVGKIAADFSGLAGRPEFTTPESKKAEELMIDNDLQWAAENRDRLLKEWRNRYAR